MRKLFLFVLILFIFYNQTGCISSESMKSMIVFSRHFKSQEQNHEAYKFERGWTESREVYKTTDQRTLTAHIFSPSSISASDSLPAFLLFHGGGWHSGNSLKMIQYCKFFAQCGWVAITFDYRLVNYSDSTPIECIMDAKSAVRWTRSHAEILHINPSKIVAAGTSAGGHLALSTGFLSQFSEESDDNRISCVPDFIICISACFNTTEAPVFKDYLPDNVTIADTSPFHNITSGLPPVLIFHGMKDTAVPCRQALDFYRKMKLYRNYCFVYLFENGKHNIGTLYKQEIGLAVKKILLKTDFGNKWKKHETMF
jgi:acetyl esterase